MLWLSVLFELVEVGLTDFNPDGLVLCVTILLSSVKDHLWLVCILFEVGEQGGLIGSITLTLLLIDLTWSQLCRLVYTLWHHALCHIYFWIKLGLGVLGDMDVTGLWRQLHYVLLVFLSHHLQLFLVWLVRVSAHLKSTWLLSIVTKVTFHDSVVSNIDATTSTDDMLHLTLPSILYPLLSLCFHLRRLAWPDAFLVLLEAFLKDAEQFVWLFHRWCSKTTL